MLTMAAGVMTAWADVTINGINYRLDDGTHTAEVTGPNTFVGDLVIPESVEYNSQTYSVTSVGSGAFQFDDDLTSIVIPNSVTTIKGTAFSDSHYYTSVSFGTGLTTIKAWAFSGANGLKDIVIPINVTNIENSAFNGCAGLKSIRVFWPDPTLMTGIGDDAFSAYTSSTLQITMIVPPGSASLYRTHLPWSNFNVAVAFDDTELDIESSLTALLSNPTGDVFINRTMYKDGAFNTLCLPFNVDNLNESPLAGCELFAYAGATKNGDELELNITPASAIEAGKPYLIRWASGENLNGLHFRLPTISATSGQAIGDDVKFVGTIGQSQLPKDNENYLFVGDANTLYWPNTNNPLKAFRAYFLVSGAVAPRLSPAHFVIRSPQDIEEINNNDQSINKTIRNGRLIIRRNGVEYNAAGQIINR